MRHEKRSRGICNMLNSIRVEPCLSMLWLQGLMPYGQKNYKGKDHKFIIYHILQKRLYKGKN